MGSRTVKILGWLVAAAVLAAMWLLAFDRGGVDREEYPDLRLADLLEIGLGFALGVLATRRWTMTAERKSLMVGLVLGVCGTLAVGAAARMTPAREAIVKLGARSDIKNVLLEMENRIAVLEGEVGRIPKVAAARGAADREDRRQGEQLRRDNERRLDRAEAQDAADARSKEQTEAIDRNTRAVEDLKRGR